MAAVALAGLGGRAEPPVEPRAWTADDSMLMIFQASREIRRAALTPLGEREWVDRFLAAALPTLDPYSRYLDAGEYADFQTAQQPGFAGTGMELMETREGELRCLPHPEGPAARAGIREGDRLLAVDGRPMTGQSPLAAGSRIRGPAGSDVVLDVQTAGGRRTVSVRREWVAARSVVRLDDPVPRLRIYFFGPQTPAELRAAVEAWPADEAVRLDLRGNPGGSLFDAVDCARLFLPAGRAIVAIERRDRRREWTSTEDGPFCARRVLVLQDGGTASAAEVFLAALVMNNRAVSAGARTFGKGVTQKVVPLMGGSALILSDGMLLPPDRQVYNGRGIEPRRPADPADPVAGFAEAAKEIVDRQPTSGVPPVRAPEEVQPSGLAPGSEGRPT